MPTDPGQPSVDAPPRCLTCEEIDERIQRVAGWVAEGSEDPIAGLATESLDPRWITPAELVRRVRPFLVYN